MPQSGFEDGFTVASSGSLDTWVKEITAKVPGAIEGYIYDQLKAVIRDFFQRTKAWRDFSGPHTALANDGLVCMNPVDSTSSVIQILSVTRNGVPLSPVTSEQAMRSLINETASRNPHAYYTQPYDTIHLVPTPVVDVINLYVAYALTPRLRDDNHIPQWVLDQHYEAVKAGVLQRLYEEPGKVYSNVKSAEFWGKKFRSELTRSRSEAAQNYKQGPQPWQYPTHTRGK